MNARLVIMVIASLSKQGLLSKAIGFIRFLPTGQLEHPKRVQT
jgi:hypothetical protein